MSRAEGRIGADGSGMKDWGCYRNFSLPGKKSTVSESRNAKAQRGRAKSSRGVKDLIKRPRLFSAD